MRVVFEKTGWEMVEPEGSARELFALARSTVVLRDGLGALGDGVLGELAGEDEADGRLAQRPSRRRGAQSQGIKVELPIAPSPLRSPFRDQLRRLAAPLAIP